MAAGFLSSLCIFDKNILIFLNRISLNQEKFYLSFVKFLTVGKESMGKIQMISFQYPDNFLDWDKRVDWKKQYWVIA